MKLATPLRNLGKTEIKITPIGLGMMEMSGGGGLLGKAFPIIPQEEKNAVIQAALDGGINWFDTAEIYGQGVSERSLAEGLKAAGKRDEEVQIATKWNPFLRTVKSIPRSIEEQAALPRTLQHRQFHGAPANKFFLPGGGDERDGGPGRRG